MSAPFRRYIGDVHHNFPRYLATRQSAPCSTQVGDFGAGFEPLPEPHPRHQFERGNHDDPKICRNHPSWIPDGAFINGAFHVGGGQSTDKINRMYDNNEHPWWPDEELSLIELNEIIDKYAEIKPNIMVTHESPTEIASQLFSKIKNFGPGSREPSRTAKALQAMLELHRPALWIFGHWHIDADQIIDGCRFICLGEHSYIDIEDDNPLSGAIIPGNQNASSQIASAFRVDIDFASSSSPVFKPEISFAPLCQPARKPVFIPAESPSDLPDR